MAILPGKGIIQKESVTLTVDCYKTPNTIPLAFSFQPLPSLQRHFTLQHYSLNGKDLYALNGYFSDEEGKELREFSTTASFSQKIYGNEMSSAYGEIPAKMMNGKERWQFFHQPPSAIQSLFELFGYLSYKINAKVVTLPWCLSDQKSTSNCVATNFLTENSQSSTEHGKHQDFNPESGLAFSIPCLYKEGESFDRFINGEKGKPLMLTVMVYATAANFRPEYGMGTFFYSREGQEVKIPCLHMQMVFFEGDIWHTIEASTLPPHLATWRVSYVFKIILNPKSPIQDLRQALAEELRG